MYKHYSCTKPSSNISDSDANDLMDGISDQWEDESTPLGKVFLPVFDWDYTETPAGIELRIPFLASGEEIPYNSEASKDFGFDIYGDCFLKI
jgi:hypothetical protein